MFPAAGYETTRTSPQVLVQFFVTKKLQICNNYLLSSTGRTPAAPQFSTSCTEFSTILFHNVQGEIVDVKENFPGLSHKFYLEGFPLKRTTPVIPAEDIQRQKEYCAELRSRNAQRPTPPLA